MVSTVAQFSSIRKGVFSVSHEAGVAVSLREGGFFGADFELCGRVL